MTDEPSESDRSLPDDEQLVQLITSSQRCLRAFILGLLPHQVDADDVLQEVNLALWRKRKLYDPEKDFLRWAFGFAAMEVRSFLSKSAKTRLWFNSEVIDLLAEDWLESESFIDESQRALGDCLEKLGTSEQEVIGYRYGKRLTVKEIAVLTNRTPSTVSKILQRSIESLGACIRRSQWQAGH